MAIPKIIHHLAPKEKEKWHPVWIDCYNSWRPNFLENEYQYTLWNDNDIDLLIKNEYPEYWETYKNFPLHIQKVDFARIAILYKYGGIYADMDLYCYQNFYDDLVEKDCYLVQCSVYDGHYDKDNEIVANFLMASKPKSSFFKDLLQKIIDNVNSYDKESLNNILSDNEKKAHYIIENGIIIMSKLYKTYDKRLVGMMTRHNYNCGLFSFHSNIKVKHMFTGMWGNETSIRMEKYYINYLKETGESISYSDFLKNVYKDKTSLDINLFTYKP